MRVETEQSRLPFVPYALAFEDVGHVDAEGGGEVVLVFPCSWAMILRSCSARA